MAKVYWIATGQGSLRIGTMARPRGGDWLADEVADLRRQGVGVLVSALTADEVRELDLTAEPATYAAAGIRFVSLPIPDRQVPESSRALLARLRPLCASLVPGEAVAVHCRAGIGRSSLLAGAILCCSGWSAADAWPAIASARGLSVPDTEEQRAWLHQFAEVIGLPT